MPKLTHRIAGGIAGGILLAMASMAWAAGPWAGRQRDITGTWLDLFNFLDLIPGPEFLFFFVVYALAIIGGLKLLTLWWLPRVEGASILDLGDQVRFELKPTYLELAYLKGGPRAAVEAAVCNLHRLGIVSAYASTRSGTASPRALPRLPHLERAVAAACEAGTSAYAIVSDRRVVQALAAFEEATQSKLRRLGLLAQRPSYLTALTAILACLVLVDGLGGIRLARALMRGHTNVAFLLLLMAAAVPAILLVFKPRLTRAGSRYLGKLKDEYRPLVRRVQARLHAWDAPEVLYALAVCGAGSLGGTGYATVHAALQPPRSEGGGSCSSCGGGGCGGGGCGGGGCGGGGCGGG